MTDKDKMEQTTVPSDKQEETQNETAPATEALPDKENRVASKAVYSLFEYVEMFATAVALVVIIISFLFRVTVVVGDSMLNTLTDGQVLLISNLLYEPATGDIIVIQPMTEDYTKPIVKRVIATAGQVVDIDFVSWKVTVDGVELDESYVNHPIDGVDMAGSYLTFPYTVPDGKLFVMGDNRNHSTDSRDSRFGPLDERYVLGRALIRVFPFDSFGKIES